MLGTKKDGITIIDNTIGKFQGIINNLDTGISLCLEKVSKNDQSIQKLTAENQQLNEKTEQAAVFKDNLQNLLTQTSSENKEEN